MKTRKTLLVVILAFSGITLSAQVFTGGSVGFSTTNSDSWNGSAMTNSRSGYSFNISPSLGKFLSENVAIGIALNLSTGGTRLGVQNQLKSRSSSIGVSPFARYYALNIGNFHVYGQGALGIVSQGSRTETGSVITKGPKTTSLYLRFNPGLAYDLTDRISIETTLNFFSIGYSYNVMKDGNQKSSNSGFSAGAGLDNILTVGDIKIGAIYKF